jgi:hypothetical protein
MSAHSTVSCQNVFKCSKARRERAGGYGNCWGQGDVARLERGSVRDFEMLSERNSWNTYQKIVDSLPGILMRMLQLLLQKPVP